MNISGNFATTEREINIVKRILDAEGVPYISVQKYANADDGDVLVTLENGKTILIEVKEEAIKRFKDYGDLGIDYISAFQFNHNGDASKWKGKHYPNKHFDFLNAIDKSRNYKDGKVTYSKSDLWLFFVLDRNDNLYYYSFFNGNDMTSPEFKNYLIENCQFAVNNKTRNQLSYRDTHHSACFFINHTNKFLNNFVVNIKDYI